MRVSQLFVELEKISDMMSCSVSGITRSLAWYPSLNHFFCSVMRKVGKPDSEFSKFVIPLLNSLDVFNEIYYSEIQVRFPH